MATAKQMRPRTLRRDQSADGEEGGAGSMLGYLFCEGFAVWIFLVGKIAVSAPVV